MECLHHAEKYRFLFGKSAAIKTFDYSDVTIRRCLAAGASPVPSLWVEGDGFFNGIRRAKIDTDSFRQRNSQTLQADPAEIGGVSCAGNTVLVTSPERGDKPCKGDFFFFFLSSILLDKNMRYFLV